MRIIGQEQIADAMGVTPKTIVEWQAMGFPVAERGGPGVPSEYDLPACIRWLVDREVKKVQAESPRDRLFRLQADKLEQDIAKDKGLLIPADQVEPRMTAAIIAAREQWMGEPPRLSMLLMGRDREGAEELLDDAFERFLVKLSNWRAAGDEEGDDR